MRLDRGAVAALLAACTVTWAGQSGGLRIRVYDAASRTPLPGATVVLTHRTQNAPAAVEPTDKTGVVAFPVLPAGGGYALEVSFPGYGKVRLADLRVRIGETLEVPVGLSEAIEERVEVVGKREVVDLEKTETSSKFSDEFIRDLPVQGRFYQNVLKLAPGVQDADGDGNPNVHGARARDFKAIVNGVSNVDPLTGEWLSYINADSIEEIEIVTAGAGVEYGRAQGGFANIIQKQGSNDFEGLFGFIYRTSKLDGNGATNVQGKRLPKFDWVQPFLQVSGAILKDRLWYILSHEYQDRESPVNILTGLAVTTRKQTIAADRLTWQASPRNKLSLEYQLDPLTLGNVGVSSTVPPESSIRQEYGGPTYTLGWTAPVSPKLLVDSTVAYQDIHSNFLPMTNGVPNDCVIGLRQLVLAQCNNLNTGLTSGSLFIASRDRRQRLTVKSQAEMYAGRFWGADHQLKFGFGVENERYFRHLDRGPILDFVVLPNRGASLSRFALASALFSVPEVANVSALGTTWAIYAEDRLRPLDNLSVTLGLRLDQEVIGSKGVLPFDPEAESRRFIENRHYGMPNPVNAQQSFTAYESLDDFVNQLSQSVGVDPSLLETLLSNEARQSRFWYRRRRPGDIQLRNTNLSPFLAASWDPWSDGKTKLGFTAGRHYNHIPLAIPTVELEPATASINFRAREIAPHWAVSLERLSGGINPTANVSVVDRNLKTPYQDEWSFTLEREVNAETAVRLTHIRRRFRDQLQDIEINHAPGDFGRCVLQRYVGDPTIVPPPDGIPDDCVGRFDQPPDYLLQRPDGFLDTYVLNPGWGGVYLVGNFNTASYRGAVLELIRRLYRGWEMNASYTWSKAIGDAEDFDLVLGDDRTTLQDERGFLSYDQRHVVKVNTTTLTPWGFRLGGAITWQSGLPYSLLLRWPTVDSLPPPYNGFGSPEARTRLRYLSQQRNDRRNQQFWTFDVKVQKELSLKAGQNLSFTAEIFNLLNDDALTIFSQTNDRISGVRRFGRQYQVGMRLGF